MWKFSMIKEIQKFLIIYKSKCEEKIQQLKIKINTINTLTILSKKDKELLILKQKREITILEKRIKYALLSSSSKEAFQVLSNFMAILYQFLLGD